MNAGRAGTSTVVGKLLLRTRQATLVAQPLVSGKKLSSLTLVGQNLGPRGVKPPHRRRGEDIGEGGPCYLPAHCRQALAVATAAHLSCKTAVCKRPSSSIACCRLPLKWG